MGDGTGGGRGRGASQTWPRAPASRPLIDGGPTLESLMFLIGLNDLLRAAPLLTFRSGSTGRKLALPDWSQSMQAEKYPTAEPKPRGQKSPVALPRSPVGPRNRSESPRPPARRIPAPGARPPARGAPGRDAPTERLGSGWGGAEFRGRPRRRAAGAPRDAPRRGRGPTSNRSPAGAREAGSARVPRAPAGPRAGPTRGGIGP